MAAWPTSLPQSPLVSGWSESRAGALVVSAMDAGPAKRRRRYTVSRVTFAYSFILTTDQVTTLMTFFETTLGMGADAFDWIHPRTRAAASFTFAGEPQFEAVGAGYWAARLALELQP